MLKKTTPKTVLVTGANRGLGLEFVRQLADLPSPPSCIIATCRHPDKAVVLQSLARNHPSVEIVQLEATDSENIKRVAKEVECILKGRGLNLLLNNAGVGPGGDLYDVTEEVMMHTFKTNVVAPLLITKAFLPFLKTGAQRNKDRELSWERAVIVNISSRLGSIQQNGSHLSGRYPYKTSKAALNMVSNTLSIDLKGEGILAVSLSPGSVKTDMGVPSAPLLPHQSVEMMLDVISGLSEEESGLFLNFNGDVIPW